jgi:hypothetical protein
MEAIRDRITRGLGSPEPWFFDHEFLLAAGERAVAAHWRKPLSVSEVAQLAPTPEVLARPGRP